MENGCLSYCSADAGGGTQHGAATLQHFKYHDDCNAGRHQIAPKTVHEAHGVRYGRCRYCGCDLMRTEVSPRWFRSGILG